MREQQLQLDRSRLNKELSNEKQKSRLLVIQKRQEEAKIRNVRCADCTSPIIGEFYCKLFGSIVVGKSNSSIH